MLALLAVSLVVSKTLRPIVYTIATLPLNRKANAETRIKVLEVLCADQVVS